jgi:hypothetical protein
VRFGRRLYELAAQMQSARYRPARSKSVSTNSKGHHLPCALTPATRWRSIRRGYRVAEEIQLLSCGYSARCTVEQKHGRPAYYGRRIANSRRQSFVSSGWMQFLRALRMHAIKEGNAYREIWGKLFTREGRLKYFVGVAESAKRTRMDPSAVRRRIARESSRRSRICRLLHRHPRTLVRARN